MVSVPDPAVLTAAFPSLPCALKREMRSNHAELGAVWIYRGVLAVTRDPALRAFAEEHGRTEAAHLAFFEAGLPSGAKRVWPRCGGSWVLGWDACRRSCPRRPCTELSQRWKRSWTITTAISWGRWRGSPPPRRWRRCWRSSAPRNALTGMRPGRRGLLLPAGPGQPWCLRAPPSAPPWPSASSPRPAGEASFPEE